MEQFETVFKHVNGYEYEAVKSENGDLTVRLIPVTEEVINKPKYFVKITKKDRKKVQQWLITLNAKTNGEQYFLTAVSEAIQSINYEYWIATMEPSVSEGKIYYKEGEKVGVGHSIEEWIQMAKEYDPGSCSRLANLHELFLWYALRIVDGLWSLHYVANDSATAGNYWKAPNSAKTLETAGARMCGGYADGQGNTRKLVDISGQPGIAMVGGEYTFGWEIDKVATCYHVMSSKRIFYNISGVLVLTK